MVLWAQFEQGVVEKPALQEALSEMVAPMLLGRLMEERYVFEKDGRLNLSAEGLKIARDMIRRRRLTERLLQDVLVLPADQVDSNTCRMEHVISSDVEAAICTLLGHPQACPHGSPIPPGRCCEQAIKHADPIVAPLTSLAAGQRGRIVYFSPHNRPELHKLQSMGFAPGAEISVSQVFPALVVSVEETLVALDPSVAQQIFIRKRNGAEGLA